MRKTTNTPAKSAGMLDECLYISIPESLQLIQSRLVYMSQFVKHSNEKSQGKELNRTVHWEMQISPT